MSRFNAASVLQAQLDGGKVKGRLLEKTLYSRVPITVAGLSSSGTSTFTLFQDNFNPHTTNIKQPGKLCQSGLLELLGFGISFHWAGADAKQYDITNKPFALAEVARQYIDGGYIKMEKNQILHHEDYGCYKYPQGGGMHVAAATSDTTTASTTTALARAAQLTNGTPDVRNRRYFAHPTLFRPTDVFDMLISYPSAIALPANTTGVLMVSLYTRSLVAADENG